MKRYARFVYLLAIYALGMLFFTAFRLVESWVWLGQAAEAIDLGGLFGRALLKGLRFDTLVSCYVLALPAVMMLVGEFARICAKGFYLALHLFINVCYTVCFFACAADIPYFCFFFTRLDVMSLTWADSFGTVVGMILGEPAYVGYLLAFVAVAVGWWFATRWIFRRLLRDNLWQTASSSEALSAPLWAGIPLAVVLVFGVVVGMRGRLGVDKSPIRVGTASFCNVPFLNQIGLNPVFTFLKSVEEKHKSRNQPVELVSAAEAEAVWAEQVAAPVDSLLARDAVLLSEGTNVVLVLMESMTVEKTCLSSNGESLTHHLDSLMASGRVYTNAWSAGIHTYNGIYSTLYGHPAILAQHTMKQVSTPQMCGLPQTLRGMGYQTAYFMTHYVDFDNMNGFLLNNGFDHVVGESDYRPEEVVGAFGVPDHVMFDYALRHCHQAAESNRPFFTCIMTCSDHAPYIMPKDIDFKPQHEELTKSIVEYADWSIGRFMQQAAREPWFSNTLFVFVADHGVSKASPYDMSLVYNHVPILFYAPGRIAPSRVGHPVMQIDIAQTVVGMLAPEVDANTLGVDMQRHRRPCAYFSADDKIGAIGPGGLFWLYRTKEERGSLYRLGENNDLADQLPDSAAAMRRYAFGMIQQSQQMLLEHATGCSEK